MRHKRRSKNRKVGLPPGSIIYTGSKESQELFIDTIDFDADHLLEQQFNNVKELIEFKKPHKTSWININGLNHTKSIIELGKNFKLHPMLVEDIVNVSQRAKLEEYEDYIFVVCKMPYFKDNLLTIEHISFVLGNGFLISFQEIEGDVFEPVRERIRNSKGIIITRDVDYLLFALLDVIIDTYAVILDEISFKFELIEDALLSNETNDDDQLKIQDLKREILRIRKAVYPLKEMTGKLPQMKRQIAEENHLYFNSLHDHVTQILENIDLNREMIWGLMDLHMTTLSNKMNQVMKVLTVIATIFIPLTFIAGVYGMNFEFMPELKIKYAYPILMGLMLLVFIFMLFFFRKKKWI